MKILAIVLFTLVMAAQAVAQPGRSQVREGNKLYEQKKYDEALNKYQDALLDAPQSPVVRYDMGVAQFKKKNYKEAIEALQKSINTDDRLMQAEAYYNIGNAQFRNGKYMESIESYKKALDINPGDVDAKFNLEYVRNFLKQNAEKKPQEEQEQEQQEDQQQTSEGQQEQQQQNQGDEQQDEQESQDQEQGKGEVGPDEQQQADKQPQAKPGQLSKEDAEQILRALEQDEKNELKKSRQVPSAAAGVLKDW